jgi:hypothetical protein
VIGHYQSLADNPGIAPESDQTRSLQSDQRTLGKAWIVQTWPFQVFSKGLLDGKSCKPLKRKGPEAKNAPSPSRQHQLLDVGLGASFFELLLRGFGVGLGHGFFDGLRCAVNQVFGFFQAEARQFAHSLND